MHQKQCCECVVVISITSPAGQTHGPFDLQWGGGQALPLPTSGTLFLVLGPAPNPCDIGFFCLTKFVVLATAHHASISYGMPLQ